MERFFVEPIKPDILVAFTSIHTSILCHKHVSTNKILKKVGILWLFDLLYTSVK